MEFKIILLVDDDETIRDSLGFMLEDLFRVKTLRSDSVKTAKEILATNKVDIIISDYMMPESDGLELLKAIEKNNLNVPFILFSSHRSIDMSDVKYSKFHFVLKPDTSRLFLLIRDFNVQRSDWN